MSIVVAVIIAVVLLLAVLLVRWNIARVRTGRLASALPDEVKHAVLAAIDRAGLAAGTPVLLLRVVDRSPSEEVVPGARLLARVPLYSPPLPAAWADRAVLVFGRDDALIARSVRAPSPPAGTPYDVLRLPPGDTVDNEPDEPWPSSPYEPRSLCRRVPELRALLAAVPDTPERLLPHILVPGIHTHEIDNWNVSVMGGEPELIQAEHEPPCGICSAQMQFLFHIGSVLDLPGDAPITYVYGCNDHPDQLAVFVDIH